MVDAPENESAHVGNDDLVLHALGEPMQDPASEPHLASCAACRSRADQLRAVVATGRSVTPDDQLVAPPPTLWEGVASAVREDEVVSLTGRRRTERGQGRRRLLTVGAVAAAAVLVASVAAVAPWRTDPAPVVTASSDIRLAPVGTATASGEAVMKSSADGATMTVDVPSLPAAAGYYEVWLMGGPDHLVSLGVLDSRHHGTFPVPDGLDVASYPYVDVSLEPLDGNPKHSGTSVVRGQLPA